SAQFLREVPIQNYHCDQKCPQYRRTDCPTLMLLLRRADRRAIGLAYSGRSNLKFRRGSSETYLFATWSDTSIPTSKSWRAAKRGDRRSARKGRVARPFAVFAKAGVAIPQSETMSSR